MKVAAFIPARYASTRLPGKPLADIHGKTLVQRVYERARACELIDTITVATDDERIFNAVKAFGGEVVMTSASHCSGADRIAEAVALDLEADIIVNIQGDEPLISPKAVDETIRPLLNEPGVDVCTLKTAITTEEEFLDPHAVKVVTDSRGRALYFSRSPIPYSALPFSERKIPPFKHIGLYVYRRDFILNFTGLPHSPLEDSESLEQLRAIEHGHVIEVVETEYNPVSVDTPEDLESVRKIFATR
ncbi:MAG: 3-deoxy-manno-octulosonate cytidylyltransferase [Thermodesulfobacteriota bacterium]